MTDPDTPDPEAAGAATSDEQTAGAASAPGPTLAGVRVLVTREHPGELGRLLAARGADVVHLPLIAVIDAPDGGAALSAVLDRLDDFDWVIVTSAAGADRVGDAARAHVGLRLAAVGTATAARLAELAARPVDVVPARQIAEGLATALIDRCPTPQRMLIAQADRAGDTLHELLSAAGHDVTVVTAYSTVLESADPELIGGADALVLASGSAAQGWVASFGIAGPPLVVAIGPSTAARARELGMEVHGVASDHSLVGVVTELERQVRQRS